MNVLHATDRIDNKDNLDKIDRYRDRKGKGLIDNNAITIKDNVS